MPSSNPLPPKENALFKRILVSYSFRTKILTVLVACDKPEAGLGLAVREAGPVLSIALKRLGSVAQALSLACT